MFGLFSDLIKPTVAFSIVIKMRKDELIIVEWCTTGSHFNLVLLDHRSVLQICIVNCVLISMIQLVYNVLVTILMDNCFRWLCTLCRIFCSQHSCMHKQSFESSDCSTVLVSLNFSLLRTLINWVAWTSWWWQSDSHGYDSHDHFMIKWFIW